MNTAPSKNVLDTDLEIVNFRKFNTVLPALKKVGWTRDRADYQFLHCFAKEEIATWEKWGGNIHPLVLPFSLVIISFLHLILCTSTTCCFWLASQRSCWKGTHSVIWLMMTCVKQKRPRVVRHHKCASSSQLACLYGRKFDIRFQRR